MVDKFKIKHEGSVYPTNKSGPLIITNYTDKKNVTVKFVETGYETKVEMCQIRRGEVRDRSLPTICGVGVIGDATTIDNKGKHLPEYTLWSNMLRRCYGENRLVKSPSYDGCSVSDEFLNFTFFTDWCNNQVGFGSRDYKNEPYALDKDILVKGNKVYSEDTCGFVPREVNNLFTLRKNKRGDSIIGVCYAKANKKFVAQLNTGKGIQDRLGYFNKEAEAFFAYKQAKESYIKEVANKWKDKIDTRVYEALMNWVVEITD